MELAWIDAIKQVLSASSEPMHYSDIADQIAERHLRQNFGATPASTVNANISLSLSQSGDQSPFVRVARGYYTLRQNITSDVDLVIHEPTNEIAEDAKSETGLINAFGMYWRRDYVQWNNAPKILGQQQPNANSVNFSDQRGVYLLHDARQVVYVGRTTDQPLGKRLYQHVSDRLNGRWDRFSWFGVYSVQDDGILSEVENANFDLNSLIVTMEALLIEGLEPPQNRKRGDEFRAIEFIQVEDPDIQKSKIITLMDELKSKL